MSEPDWNMLYQQLLPQVYNFFRYRVTDRMLAEDLTATTFKQAWQSRQRYNKDIADFSTWLFVIARRVAADHFRRHYQQAEITLDDEHLLSDGDSPEDLAERQELLDHMRSLICQLPEREQELIALKYGAVMSHQQIAELTGLSPSNVAVIVHRAVDKLRQQMKVHDESA